MVNIIDSVSARQEAFETKGLPAMFFVNISYKLSNFA